MDETPDDVLILNPHQSYHDYMKEFASLSAKVAQEVEETACELAECDSVFDSKGEAVLVRRGTTKVASSNFKTRSRDVGGSAILRITFWDANGKRTGTKTEIRSPLIKAALKTIVPMYKDRNFTFTHLTYYDKPQHLFHFRDALYNYAQQLEPNSIAQQHVWLFFVHLQQELADAISAYTVHVEFAPTRLIAPCIDFPHLWTIFKQGELVYFPSAVLEDSADMLATFKSMTCNCTCNDASHYSHHSWVVQGVYIDSTGKGLCRRETSAHLSYFDGLCELDRLAVFPLRFHPRKETIRSQLTARGRKYVQLQGRNHRHYKGLARILLGGQLLIAGTRSQLTWVHGRIMIDEETFFENAPSCIDTSIPLTSPFTDEEYMICRSHVRGFSFSEGNWGYFSVDHIEPIEFDTTVFKSSLILEDKYKSMLLSLVRMQDVNSEGSFRDFIEGKGRGLVFLLHGEPGVGKTMTAESLADFCERPLLRINGDTLENSSIGFEAGLSRVLQVAHSWKAVALLDDADMFLEQQTQPFQKRHPLTTAFLRLLECHQGVLFLTTNRLNSFDRAFKSRIQVAIYYPPLDIQSRQTLWQRFLSKSSHPATRMEDWYEIAAEVALEELNGRQIRDVVRIAQASAYDF
ncbi:hypothetical protein CEP54_005135 [Fusarium duplospermum]|uniref:AAA+ ATPase domain-containing protein n=1 Tax=Fusarium duplospermum TaxID=1325734 RepID=A0A428QE58_9HYPO|nr:hypothetical protein CEP54_005135 [Fusarium duplospermum]